MPIEDRWFSLPVGTDCGIPRGLSLDGVAQAFGAVLARHEALRTYFSPAVPEQFVVSSAEPDLTVVEVGSGEVGLAMVDEVTQTLAHSGFDLQKELPWRATVITCEGRPVHAVVVNHHIAADGWGAANLVHDLRLALQAVAAGTDPDPSPASWHPIDQALQESGAMARLASDRAAARWMAALAADPFNMLAPFRGPGVKPYRSNVVRLRSTRVAGHCATAVRRLGASSTAVLLAAFAAAVAEHTGCPRFSAETVVSNRFRQKTLTAVVPLSLPVPVQLDLTGDDGFDDAVARVYSASVQAYRFGHFDPAALKAAEVRYVRERGVNDNPALDFNYHAYSEHEAAPAAGDEPDGVEEFATTTEDGPGETVFVDAAVRGGILQIDAFAGDHLLSAADLERIVERVTDLVRAAAGQVMARGRLTPRPAGPGWARVGNGWVHLGDTRALLAECPGVRRAGVFASGADIRAYVVPEEDGKPRPGALRAWLLDRIADHPSVMAPSCYLLCHDSATGPGEDGWRAAIASDLGADPGSGTDAAPVGEAESMLARILGGLLGVREIRMDASYSDNGGTFLAIPALIAALQDLGCSSPKPNELLSPSSLRHLAASLTPLS